MIVTILNAIEFTTGSSVPRSNVIILDTLIISCLQNFLFSSTIITMLNSRFYTVRKVLLESLPSVVLSIIGSVFFFLKDEASFKRLCLLFTVYFAFQIVYYSFLYLKQYKGMIKKVDNYFSETESHRLRWTALAFFWLFVVSILCLFSLFMNIGFFLFFTVCYSLFYLFFSIHYLNYVYTFMSIESALQLPEENAPIKGRHLSSSFEQLEASIQQWEWQKGYLETGITIEHVASQLNTNRTYLSNHINTYRKRTFKDWINQLRIEEAQKLIIENPCFPVSQIGTMVGLPDKSNFGRLFTKVLGMSPQAWRKLKNAE
jgi:YesN/AraC family two-component response regulator